MIYDFKTVEIAIVWDDGKQKVKSKNSKQTIIFFEF
jgi:hypothetical protein